tara:strand:- start:1569 stop:2888 length:1320 start_codon:yes stop_codon:yes gene_type:complete
MRLKSYLLRNSFWIIDYFKKSIIRDHYNDIQTILQNKNGKGSVIREKHLQNLLNHAVQNTTFYSALNTTDFKEFPVINKMIIQKNSDNFRATESSIPLNPQIVYIYKTSGSTGIPFNVIADDRKRNRKIAEYKYFGKRIGFNSHENLVSLIFWNKNYLRNRIKDLRENIINFNASNLSALRLGVLSNVIKKKNVIALRGPASAIDQFVQYVTENNIVLPSLKFIIAGSEALFDSTRVLVEENMDSKIFSQYANQENGLLGQQSIHDVEGKKYFYLNHASYIFEIFKMDSDELADYGELGRIVITDLFNYAQPMIRYETGDTGIMIKDDNNSNGYPVLSFLYGRRTDLIYDIYGKPINPIEIFNRLKYFKEIIQFQFIQIDQFNYKLKLKTREPFAQDIVIKELKEMFGGEKAKVNYEFVNDIAVLASGKRKAVSNEWKC